jgi:glycosyltransferase involved in cell wall biosynthesis
MPKISVNILTKNREKLLQKAVASVFGQSFSDWELIIVDDGSSDGTIDYLAEIASIYPKDKIKIISHAKSLGITQSRQEALLESRGEYVAVLDDDDEWAEKEKLSQQLKCFEKDSRLVLVGGGVKTISNIKYQISKFRPETDWKIRSTMLFRNNFFTSTVMFKKEAAVKAGGFVKDGDDFAEDYDLWLRMGKLGKMRNLKEVLAAYRVPNYNKERYLAFFKKQLRLIKQQGLKYPFYFFANLMLKYRINQVQKRII